MLGIVSIYLGILILGIGEVIFAKIVLNKKVQMSILSFLFVFLGFTFLYTLMYINFSGIVKSSLFFIAHMFEFKILFNINYSKALFLSFLHSIVLVIIDILSLLVATNLGMTILFCYDEFAGSILGNAISCLFLILLVMILRKPLRKLINTEVSCNSKILILSLATFLCVGMIFYLIIKTYKLSNDIFLYLIAMIVLIVVLFSLIKQTLENSRLIKEYDKLLGFMTTYENEIEKQRISRHETKNDFLAIKAKICDRQNDDEIIEYIDGILNEKNIVNQEKYAKFGYLPPNGIKGLLYFKVQEAENCEIDVSISISPKIKKCNINELSVKEQKELGRILGVFLDNAIEASNNSVKKLMGIEVYSIKDKGTMIVISNTFDNKINENKIGKEKYSTKGKDRGHGLLLVKNIIDKNDIFEIKTNIERGLYTQIVLIKDC